MSDLDGIDYSTPEGAYRRWMIEIEEAEKWSKPWVDRAVKVLRRYRDQKPDQAAYIDRTKKLNIFWSNVETLKPALYARRPKPVVERRYKDADPVARVACELLERSTSFLTDCDQFDELMKQCRDDYLIVGRGTAWVRYVPHFVAVNPPAPAEGVGVTDDAAEYESAEAESAEGEVANVAQEPAAPDKRLAYEEVAIDYIHWRDFLMSPARTWREVRWVDRKVQMTREELIERFGKKIGNAVKLDAKPEVRNGEQTAQDRVRDEIVSRAVVHEIWNLATRKVCWVSKGYDAGVLDERDDPLRLKEFFPCPRPMFATLTTDSLNPIPDFCMYQDQADELDDLTDRLSKMIEACQNKGVYDKSQDAALARIMQEGNDNRLIPVDNWASFSQAGGLKGVMDFVPLDPTIAAIQQLTVRSAAVKADIYEITGISDIIRGYSDANETATAQEIKGQFAALRLKDRQAEVARFARDLIAMTAEIVSDHFQPQTVALMAGVAEMQPDAQQSFPAAMQLLRDDAVRGFRVEIETDSTIAVDEQGDKAAATDFLRAMGEYLAASLPVAQQAPELLGMLGEGAMFLSRRFRAGRQLETSIEAGFKALEQRAAQMAQNPQPDPMQAKAEAEIQAIGAKTEAEIQALQMKTQAGLQAQQTKMQGQMALAEYKALAQPALPQLGVQ